MSYKKFTGDDVFVSRVKTHPKYKFFVYDSNVFINDEPHISGSSVNDVTSSYLNVAQGHISLRELNVGSSSSGIHYQIQHSAYRNMFKIGSNLLANNGRIGNMIGKILPSGSQIPQQLSPSSVIEKRLPLSSSIYREVVRPVNQPSNNALISSTPISSIMNPLRSYAHHNSVKYPLLKNFNSLYSITTNNVIRIPSIFYGSNIKKGSVDLKFFYAGELISRCTDAKQNGELVVVYDGPNNPTNYSGSTAGFVFYDLGIMFFPHRGLSAATGSLIASGSLGAQSNGLMKIDSPNTMDLPKWIHFGIGLNGGNNKTFSEPNASFEISFEGTNYINNMSMFCHMEKGEYNFSNNPTYQDLSQTQIRDFNAHSSSYNEFPVKIKNVASSSFKMGEDAFRKTTYVTKIGIYDENDHLIMVADLSRPYRKEEAEDLTFKINYDLL